MWEVKPTDRFNSRATRYAKKHLNELRSVSNNLDTYLAALRAGAKLKDLKFGFLHTKYPMGIRSIVQTGPKNLMPTRLYIYPDEGAKIVHAITLGDKQTQSQDVQFCKEFVSPL
jgi:hypothetical protein